MRFVDAFDRFVDNRLLLFATKLFARAYEYPCFESVGHHGGFARMPAGILPRNCKQRDFPPYELPLYSDQPAVDGDHLKLEWSAAGEG